MAMLMGPPQLPGYSLRVQLYAQTAHDSTDKPLRCFRVVTSPERSIREFCEEASRIHEINYGEPLSVKKCQDDQEFDITQSEILGNLFANTATIRVIQAATGPGVRDSVPPTSALRFDPTSRKRGRESSPPPRINGSAPPTSYKPNKRQRLTDLDPDQPLPSREGEQERNGFADTNHIPDIKVIPSSQESIILGTNHDFHGNSRQVRPYLPQIPETPSPSPSPPPMFSELAQYDEHPTDHQVRKPALSTNENSSHNSEADNSSPLKQASVRAQSHGASQSRAKSASYHIQRATERGTSVSTAATSPLSTDYPNLARNGFTSATNRKTSDSGSNSGRRNGHRKSRSPNEDIYENIASGDEESAAILNAKKATLKMRKSQNVGLQGMDWANNQFNTPPNGRRNSRPRDTPGELPLTPNSKERERRQQDADDAKKARLAAAQAAEQRKREADEAREAEEQRIAEQDRARREELERIEHEDFRRGEAERAAIVARAARLQKEKEERDKREAEEAQKREEQRKEEERLAQEKARKENEAAEKLKRNKAMMAEAKQKREEEEKAQADSATFKQLSSDQARKSSPAIIPSSARRSSTAFIPGMNNNGRKSTLKNTSRSSQAIFSSSPAPTTVSPERAFNGVGLEAQMPLPKDKSRRVSFDETPTIFAEEEPEEEPPKKAPAIKWEATIKQPPIKSTSRIVPPGKSMTPIPVPKSILSKTQKSQVPLERQSKTRIPPPPTAKRLSSERSVTPIVPPKAVQPRKVATPQAAPKKSASPPKESNKSQNEPSKSSPPITPAAKKSFTPVQPASKTKLASEFLKTIEPPKKEASDDEASADDESDEEIPSKAETFKSASKSPAPSKHQSPARKVAADSDSKSEDEQQEIDEAASNRSSRDSRSPVTFSQHPGEAEAAKSKRSVSPDSASESEDEPESDKAEDGDASGEDEQSEAEAQSKDEASDMETTEVQVPNSSPTLPRHRPTATPSGPAFESQDNSKNHTTERDSSTSTQGEIDQQLTSSMFEVRRSPKSTPPKPMSSISRPVFKVGASLMDLNSRKGALLSSTARNGTQASQLHTLKEVSGSEDEEDEEDDDSSDDESGATAKLLNSARSVSSQARNTPKPTKKDDSDDTTDSDSENEDEGDATQELQARLRAQIADFAAS